jgi:hypothetical protein
MEKELKIQLKEIEEDIWKLITFRLKEGKNYHNQNFLHMDAIYMYKREIRVFISIEIILEKKEIKIEFYPSEYNELIIVEGTKLTEKVYDALLKAKLSNIRLDTLTTNEYKIIKNKWNINLYHYEKKWSKEEIFDLQEDIEDIVSQTWTDDSNNTKSSVFYLIGEVGEYLKELLVDEMMIMVAEKEGDGIYKAMVNETILNAWLEERLAKKIAEFLKDKSIIVID